VKSSSDMSGPGYPPDDRVRVGTGTQAAGGRLQSTATGSGTVPVATAAGQLPVTPSRSPPPPNGRRRSDSESESARSDLPVCWLSNEYFRVPSLSGTAPAPAQPHRHSRTVTGPLIVPPPPLAAPQKFLGRRRICFASARTLQPVWDVPVAPRQFAIMMAAGYHWQCQPEPQTAPAAATVADSA
jgi:hypothetical protein